MGCKRKGDIEMYSDGQFFTMTGHLLPGVRPTIENREKELRDLYSKIFSGGQTNSGQSGSLRACSDLSDEEIIAKAMAGQEWVEV